jgi:hypothetical protein
MKILPGRVLMSLPVTNPFLVDDSISVVGPQAWRVALDFDGEWYHRPRPSIFQRVGRRARAALEQAGLTCAFELRLADKAAVLRMVESLPWWRARGDEGMDQFRGDQICGLGSI